MNIFKGKTLFATIFHNPRRAKAYGFKAFQIILDNPGITYEEFIAQGGRYQDLKWDFERSRIELVH